MSVLQQGVDAVGIRGQETPLGATSKTSHVLHVVSNRVRDRLQKVQVTHLRSTKPDMFDCGDVMSCYFAYFWEACT